MFLDPDIRSMKVKKLMQRQAEVKCRVPEPSH